MQFVLKSSAWDTMSSKLPVSIISVMRPAYEGSSIVNDESTQKYQSKQNSLRIDHSESITISLLCAENFTASIKSVKSHSSGSSARSYKYASKIRCRKVGIYWILDKAQIEQ